MQLTWVLRNCQAIDDIHSKPEAPMTTMWREVAGGFEAKPLQVIEGGAMLDVGAAEGGLRIVPFREGTRPSHVLLVRDHLAARVNGWPVVGGIRVLDHKDEITVGGQRMYFSAQSQPTVEVYQHDGSQRGPRCPICRTEVQNGQAIVRCPSCLRIYHQIDATGDTPAKPCWTYSPECRFCSHPTSLSGDAAWRPEEEA
jgi:hypothetical protein